MINGAGQIIPTSFSNGLNGPDNTITTLSAAGIYSTETGNTTPVGNTTTSSGIGSTLNAKTALMYLAVIVVILILMRFMRDDKRTEKREELVPLNVYNVVIIALIAIFGLAFFKIVANKYQIAGLTDLANAV